jgi:putative peptidoglycan lipid II flippase
MFFNVTAVVGGVVLLLLDLDALTAVTVWAVLVVVGGAMQFLIQVPSLRAVGFRARLRPDLRFRDPGLRQIVRRMGPVVIALAGTNIMVVITTILASRGEGWASSLNYAFRLVHLPIGLVGVAIGTVVLAAGSRRSAAADGAGLDDVIRRGLRLNWFLALPAAAGLYVLAEPLVRLIYERGAFGPDSTSQVAEALRWYAAGIVFYAGVKAAAPHFLARGDTRTPMLCSLVAIAANLVVAFALIDRLGLRALALAVAAGAATNYLLLRTVARRRFGEASAPGWAFLGRCAVATGALLGGGLALTRFVLTREAVQASSWLSAALTLGAVALLGALYFLVAAAVGLDEGAWVRRRFLKRRRS